MPTRDQVIQVPFVGGIDEYTDPDQLQPPGMAALENAVVRKTGRVEKREGFQYLEKYGVPGVPADSFGASSGPISPNIEALGVNSGKDGSRLLLASDNTLFEYVGSDATHGFRDVNRLPSCYGTLHPIDATGGEVIEVESMLDDAGAYRCTVWVLGVRNGQDLTNDRAISSQPNGTHGVYVAVQRVNDGSFVLPPARVLDASGGPTSRACDLRMTKCLGTAGNTRNWVVAFRRDYAVIEAFFVNAEDWSVSTTRTLLTPFTGRPYWRAFDITGVTGQRYFLLAFCQNDNAPSSSDVSLRLVEFDISTGNFSTLYTMPGGVLANTNASGVTPYSVNDWSRYTPRGVVLEASPDPVTASVAVAVRTIYEMNAAPNYLDGKFVAAVADCSSSSISMTADQFAWLHRAAFQTEDSFSLFSTASQYQSKYSGTTSSTGTVLEVANYGAQTSQVTTVTARFADGSVQTYQANIASPGVGGAVYQLPAVYKGNQSNATILASGLYPSPEHLYPSTNIVKVSQPCVPGAISVGEAAFDQRNITRVQLGGAPGVVSVTLANTVQYCRLNTGAGVRCLALVAFGPTGIPTEVDLYSGEGAGNALGAPALVDIILLETGGTPYAGPWAAPLGVPANTIQVYDDFNNATGLVSGAYVFEDIGLNTQPTSQSVVETDIGVEQCVHRWDVAISGSEVVLAVSSTSAATFSGPNGDAPLGYVSPFARSNYFEVYPWEFASDTRHDLNAYGTGGSSPATPIWCAAGGPWRMVGGLVQLGQNRLGCVLMPSGDDFQRSAFFVSFTDGGSEVQTLLDPIDSLPIQTSSGVVYTDNKGIFVESMNMPRIAAVPINCPRFTSYGDMLCLGAIRQGQGDGTNEVHALQYTRAASDWRTIKNWGDYSVVNGGIVSTFDGSSCNEVVSLLWPQRDLTSIAYPPDPTNLFTRAFSSPYPIDSAISAYSFYGAGSGYALSNISRPWFAYEAGLKNKSEGDGVAQPVTQRIPWATISTQWGGDPTGDYQSIYADPRLMQVSGSKYNNGVGLSQAGSSHYYGRYQSGFCTKIPYSVSPLRLALWVPRTSPDTSNYLNSVYNPLVANGDFLARWCYEAIDGTGRVVRSAPSQAVTFSICSAIRYTERSVGGVLLTNPDVDVDEYRYGFFVPRLELTNRLKTAATDSKRTVLQPYFTAEPFATVFYKVPFSNFMSEFKNDFTISRNATRGVIPYSGSNAGAPGDNPYGLIASNLTCFDGPQGEYNGILSQPVLYTVGGGLDNVAPPSALCMTVHQNRLVVGGADDATVVWFSKELSPTDAPQFNDALTIQIEDGGAVTGLASLESLLIIFKRGMTWLVPGDMPDDTGSSVNRGYVSNTLGTPVRMPHGIGCVDHRSVIETPVGVFFKSERTIELLASDMSITPVGLKLDDTLSVYTEITSASHNATDTEVWFALRDPYNVTSIVFAVYNYTTDVWSKHVVDADADAPPTLPMTIMDNNVYFAINWDDPLGVQPVQAVVYQQTESKFFDVTPEGRKYVLMAGTTAPIALNNVQGYQRVKRVRLIGSPIPTKSTGAPQSRNPHGMLVGAFTAYALTGPNNGFQLAQWTEAEAAAVYADQNREVYEVHVKEQKGQKVSVGFQEIAPADIYSLSHGYGTAFSNMSIVVGLKAGLDKRITPGAKH